MDKLLEMFRGISIHDLTQLETDIAIWAGCVYDFSKDDNPICCIQSLHCTRLEQTSATRPRKTTFGESLMEYNKP